MTCSWMNETAAVGLIPLLCMHMVWPVRALQHDKTARVWLAWLKSGFCVIEAGQVWSYAGTEIPTVWQLRALDIASEPYRKACAECMGISPNRIETSKARDLACKDVLRLCVASASPQ